MTEVYLRHGTKDSPTEAKLHHATEGSPRIFTPPDLSRQYDETSFQPGESLFSHFTHGVGANVGGNNKGTGLRLRPFHARSRDTILKLRG